MALISTTRRFTFRSVHALHTGALRERTHGHQYFLEVSTEPAQAQTLARVIETEILKQLDRRDLTKVLDPTTGEVLVNWIHERLVALGFGSAVHAVALQETRKNRFLSARSDRRWI